MEVIEVREFKGKDYTLEVNTKAGKTTIAGYPDYNRQGIYYFDDPTKKLWIEFPLKKDGSPSKINSKGVKVTADSDNVWVHHKNVYSSISLVEAEGVVADGDREFVVSDKAWKRLDELELWIDYHDTYTVKKY